MEIFLASLLCLSAVYNLLFIAERKTLKHTISELITALNAKEEARKLSECVALFAEEDSHV